MQVSNNGCFADSTVYVPSFDWSMCTSLCVSRKCGVLGQLACGITCRSEMINCDTCLCVLSYVLM